MSDLIDRQAAIDGKICIQRSNGVEIYDDYAVPVEYLKQLPPAQPERIKGHWVNGRCDKCNEHAPFWAMASTYYASNFCSNCGSDNREVTT